MPETVETAEDAAAVGRAGETSTGRSGEAAGAPNTPVLTKEHLRQIGEALNGKHWQTSVAERTGNSKSQMTRYLNGERDINPMLPRHLQYVLVERIQEIIQLLHTPGMPYAGTQKAQDAIDAVLAAVDPIPGIRPPRKRSGALAS